MLTGLIVFSLMLGSIPLSESAVLWDLLIQADVENALIFEGDIVILNGQVTDHAGKTLSDVQIRVRTGQTSVNTVTDSSGQFRVELEDSQRMPGIYLINIMATAKDGRLGMSSTSFQVKGDLDPSTALARKLSTEQAQKYLNSTKEDFENDSVGLKLYNHYQELFEKFLEEVEQEGSLSEEQEYIQKQRIIANELREQAIEEKKPGAGIYSGWSHDRFVELLDPSVKEIIVNQLNYTKATFAEAQDAMNKVLEDGGTMEEARKAYFEKAVISRSVMESLTTNQTMINEVESINNVTHSNATSINMIATNNTDINNNNSTDVENDDNNNYYYDSEMKINVNGTNININATGTSIFVKVNGTVFKFIVNGTELQQISTPE